ncbi:hypothetical protein [Mesopusillimonas faecipullorum]|nr:hypothetical protein [Mesopusillimonas faecipullorum]
MMTTAQIDAGEQASFLGGHELIVGSKQGERGDGGIGMGAQESR